MSESPRSTQHAEHNLCTATCGILLGLPAEAPQQHSSVMLSHSGGRHIPSEAGRPRDVRGSGRPGALAFSPSPPAAVPPLPYDYNIGAGGAARTCPTAAGLKASSRRPAPQRRRPSGSPAPSRSQAGPPTPRYLATEPPLLLAGRGP